MELVLNKNNEKFKERSEFDFFEKVVNLNSYTYDLESISKIQHFIKTKFEKLSCRVEEHLNNENIPLLEIHFGNSNLIPITLISHSDCVQVADESSKFKIKGNEITGSGVIDNKAAIYMSYKLVSSLFERDLQENVHIRILVYPSEERGSIGFEELSKKFGQSGRYFLGLEPALENESIIHCRGGNRWYELEVTGEEFHSGRIKKNETNIGHELMREALNAVDHINQIEGVKFNLTHIESSDETFNTTIKNIRLRFDLRFLDNKKRDHVDSILRNNFFQQMKVSFSIHDDCPAMEDKKNNFKLISLYQKSLRRQINSELSYGAADINYISNENNICLDGLGAVGGNMHGKVEFLYIDKLRERISALEKLIIEVSYVYN